MRSAIMLDVPNLLRGSATAEGPALLARQLAAVERAARALFDDATPSREAFALDTITARSTGDAIASAGYQVVWCPSDRTRSMDMKRMSRIDDYVLQRAAKRRAVEGVRAILIVSADRDAEAVADDLAGSGVRVAYAQWDPVPASRGARVERVCLAAYDAPEGAATPRASVAVRRAGAVVASAALRDGMVIGRPSRSLGQPDVDLSAGAPASAQEFAYSRRVAVLRRMGDAWVLWRLADAAVEMELADGGRPGPGGCVVLPRGETVVKVASAGVELVVSVSEAKEAER